MFLHVVKERPDGIVVRGSKAHQTGAVNSHEIIVMPTLTMREEDKDYAVSFAVSSDSPGITYIIGRAAQTAAEYNGAEKASHIKDKIVEMNHLNETLFCGCIAWRPLNNFPDS